MEEFLKSTELFLEIYKMDTMPSKPWYPISKKGSSTAAYFKDLKIIFFTGYETATKMSHFKVGALWW